MTVGDRIRQARLNQDVTQQELADYIGVSKQAVYKYENNIVTNIPLDKIDMISSRLSVSPAYLMGWDEEKNNPSLESANAALPKENGKVSEIMKLFVNLPEDKQEQALAFLRFLSENANS